MNNIQPIKEHITPYGRPKQKEKTYGKKRNRRTR
jgi:hypothetical protein